MSKRPLHLKWLGYVAEQRRSAVDTPSTPAARSYVFARPIAFDLECPHCGTLDVVRHRRPAWRKRTTNFNPVASRWRCRSCRRIFAVGLALWPVTPTGNRRGGDTVVRPAETRPTYAQIAQLRELYGVVRQQTRGRGDPVNLLCDCLNREDFDPACPFHGGE